MRSKPRELKPKTTKPPAKRSRLKHRVFDSPIDDEEYNTQPSKKRNPLSHVSYGMHYCTVEGCKRKEQNKGFRRPDNLRVHLRSVHGWDIPKLVRKRRNESGRSGTRRTGPSSESDLFTRDLELTGPLLDGSSTLEHLELDSLKDLDSHVSSRLLDLGDGLDHGLQDLDGGLNLAQRNSDASGLQAGHGLPQAPRLSESLFGSGTFGNLSSMGQMASRPLDLDHKTEDFGVEPTDRPGSTVIAKPKVRSRTVGKGGYMKKAQTGIRKFSPKRGRVRAMHSLSTTSLVGSASPKRMYNMGSRRLPVCFTMLTVSSSFNATKSAQSAISPCDNRIL